MSARRAGVRAWLGRVVLLAILVSAGLGVYRSRQAQAGTTLPSAPVKKGDFLVLVRCRGALRARQSVGIYTPVVPNLRIAWLATAGETVKEGDVIVRFDSSTAQQQFMQKDAQLSQSQATLDQAIAQSAITAQQDQTDLADAKFSVERAQVQAKLAAIESRDQGRAEPRRSGRRRAEAEGPGGHRCAPPGLRVNPSIASLTRQRDQAQVGRRDHQGPHRPDGAEGARQRPAHAAT